MATLHSEFIGFGGGRHHGTSMIDRGGQRVFVWETQSFARLLKWSFTRLIIACLDSSSIFNPLMNSTSGTALYSTSLAIALRPDIFILTLAHLGVSLD
ncbi:MAG: hypothetical protein WC457_00690 [Patescibacteria group bacterium]